MTVKPFIMVRFMVKKIDVFGKSYKIVYVDLSEEDKDGATDNKKSLIEIDKTLTGRDLQHTLLHEMFHAVMYRLSISQALDDGAEEIIADSFATFLCEHFDFDFNS